MRAEGSPDDEEAAPREAWKIAWQSRFSDLEIAAGNGCLAGSPCNETRDARDPRFAPVRLRDSTRRIYAGAARADR